MTGVQGAEFKLEEEICCRARSANSSRLGRQRLLRLKGQGEAEEDDVGEDSMVGTIGGGQLKSPVLVESGDEGEVEQEI